MADGALSTPSSSGASAPPGAPHHLDAEQALLGALVFDDETYYRSTS
ncbi:MAG: hypothetical protein AB7L65_09385 [Hyphomonadaceae bacterium]